ncbi:MAG TPA: hypothetical protein VMG74_10790 [Gaiellaceae bacterium]|nr:hypothetical protein [Gaiellaceae bacterium]
MSGRHFTAAQVRAGFASAGFRLTEGGYHVFGPAGRVHYLYWARGGGVHKTPKGFTIRSAKEFYVLVFRTAGEAQAALRDRSVRRYLRVSHIPAARRGNVVLSDKVPVSRGDWRRWTAALSRVGGGTG